MKKKNAIILGVAVLAIAVVVYIFKRPDQTPGVGAPIVSVSVPALDAIGADGKTLFNANCAKCHGANAAGQEGVAPPLVHRIYRPGHHSDLSFQRAARYGVRAHHWPFGNMPPVPGVSPEDVRKIVAYVRELQRANGIN